MVYSIVVEDTAVDYTVNEYTATIVGHTTSKYIVAVVEKTMVVATQTMEGTAVVVATLLISVLIPSCSTYPSSLSS